MSLTALLASASFLVSPADSGQNTADYRNYQKPAIYAQIYQPTSQTNRTNTFEVIRYYVGIDNSNPEFPESRALFFEYRSKVYRSVKEAAAKDEHPLKFVRRVLRAYLPSKKFGREFYHKATELFNLINRNGFNAPSIKSNSSNMVVVREPLPNIKMTLIPGALYEVPVITEFNTLEEAIESLK